MRRSLALLVCAAACSVASCDATSGACPGMFITAFATRAFRRPATKNEIDGLTAVFHTAADGATFADGVQAVIAAALQSASFLYIPALGTGDGANKKLDPYETASALSFFLTASPPDDALLDAAAKNALATAAEREAQARRLFADPRTHAQV